MYMNRIVTNGSFVISISQKVKPWFQVHIFIIAYISIVLNVHVVGLIRSINDLLRTTNKMIVCLFLVLNLPEAVLPLTVTCICTLHATGYWFLFFGRISCMLVQHVVIYPVLPQSHPGPVIKDEYLL